MSAYLIVEIDVTDAEAYSRYGAAAAPAVAHYGGRYLVRGGASETLEGNWQPKRLVVVEFDSMDQARSFFNSQEYAAARRHRQGATSFFNAVLVEGAPPA